jgi:hypothetical protein
MNLPLIDAAEYFLNLKQAAGEILPAVEEHADEGGLLDALSEAAKSKLGLAIAYRVYSESLRDPSNSAIGEHFKEHSEDCLNDVDFFVRRSSVMSGGASLDGVESPPASGDLTEILHVLSRMEEANLQLMSELVVLLEGNPSKYEVEAMMAKDQHHLDDLTQHMPVATELPSVAEEVPSVEEAAPPPAAAAPGVIGPAKVAGVSAAKGLGRVKEIFTGSRVSKLEDAADKARGAARIKGVFARAVDDGASMNRRLAENHAYNEGDRWILKHRAGAQSRRAKSLHSAAQTNTNRSQKLLSEASTERSKQVGAIGGTAAAATGAVIGAKKLLSKKEDGNGKEKTSEMGAAAMGQHPPVPPPPPLSGPAAGQHAKMAQRTYDMGGSKRDGKAYSMHTTPDEYELSQLINSKMEGDLRGVRGKAKNEGMLVGSGLGAVKGLKAGKGWGGGQVIRTGGGGGGTVIGTFGSGGKMPKGMGADIRENQGMIRDELRGQGIKIGGALKSADKSDSELAETGRQRAVANLASGFTSDKHTSGERHGTLAGRLGGAAVGAGAGALASRGATLPVRLAAGMGGAVIGGSMGGQIGKTIGSDHDAEKFWANHKEASEGVPETIGRAVGRVAKSTGIHDMVTTGDAGPLGNAVKKPLVDIKNRISSGYSVGSGETKGWKERHTKEAAGIGSLVAPDVSQFTKRRRKIAQAKQAGLVDSARSLISRVTSRPTVSSIGKTLQSVEHSGEGLARKAMAATTAPGLATRVHAPTTGTLPSAVSHLHAPSGHSTLDLDLHHMAQEKKFHDSQPSWARKAITESKYVRPSGSAPDVPTPSSAGRMSPEVAASLARLSKQPGETAAQAMVRLSKVAAAMRQLGYSSSGPALIHGDKEMTPVLGKRVIRNAKQVWDKAVKQAMGEEVPVEQYLQEEAAGRQAQEAAESDYLRQQLQQTSQQLEQTQAQAQQQEAQVGEMQGTIQQLQGQQAEQAQAADAAVQTARQTAEAAMGQSMQRSAELMKQTQLAAGLQNAAATMKEQLLALSQTPVPPATVGEAGKLDAAAQQQVGQGQAMEDQAAMEEQAQMAAAQGAPPAPAAPPAQPKTAGMISGAGRVLRNAPGGVVGGVVGAASAAGLGALLRHKETAFLTDAAKKLEAKQQGGFLTGMMLAEAKMMADRSAVMDQHPGKAAILNAVRGAGAGFALDKTIRHIS